MPPSPCSCSVSPSTSGPASGTPRPALAQPADRSARSLDVSPAPLLTIFSRRSIRSSSRACSWPGRDARGGETGLDRVSPHAAERLVGVTHELYLAHPDPGVHSAAELVLRRWGRESVLAQADEQLRREPRRAGRRALGAGPEWPHPRHPSRTVGIPDGLSAKRGRAIRP